MSNPHHPRDDDDVVSRSVDRADRSEDGMVPSSRSYISSDVYSEQTVDTLEDLLSRFTLQWRPTYALKLRTR